MRQITGVAAIGYEWSMASPVLASENPFATASTLPYGLPDFAAVRVEHLGPALETGMAQQRQEWSEIAAEPAAPTVANTLDALERSGRLLTRAAHVLHTLVGSIGTGDLRALETEMAPRLADHADAFWLDDRIYGRLRTLAESGEATDAETAWVLQRYVRRYERSGILLAEAERARLRELNARITSAQTRFGRRVVQGLEAGAVPAAAAELEGLPASTISALRQAASERGRDGALVTLRLPTAQPIVGQAPHRELRRRVHTASVARGSGADPESDTRALVLDLSRLRAERARLLGFSHHADYVAQGATARTADAVTEMLGRLAGPAVANADREAQALQRALDHDEPGARLQPWDWAFYFDRVRQQQYSFDESGLRPYLELDRVIHDGVFYAAEQLYGITLALRPDLRGYAEGVRVYEVREADGRGLGLFVADFHAREGKRGGAWMHHLVDASGLLGDQAVVVDNLNIARPSPGEPTLLSWDEVITAFHEFGHALHGLFASSRYPSVSGTSVPRDFVEYPSQVNEMWAWHPRVLARFARHHVTGEPMPHAMVERLRASQAFGEGFATTEYLAAALLDQAWHRLGPDDVPAEPHEVEPFEMRELEAYGLAHPLVPPRYRSTYFNHTFGGGYDAGYYSYLWSEVLDADTVDWFRQVAADSGDGGLNRAAGRRFREALLSRGHSQDPLDSYRDLRGRDPIIDPLLRRRGLDS
ncbi:M3 family metallopeptidase [Ruania suaedae]|uniref:M3 family metallopeptidase n=1 Tax=Ruania suaedae TaxID=2897774 RepID=UPI001E3CF4A5|nr:M3 family metallopeptidase [Ruania suaedae]UFU04378.1 M3 family metallopeptidase [Ruania suaedae]